VLEPFGQVETSLTRRREGSGLGLPLAKALTEVHGGAFAIASTVDLGTRVRFSLPASRILPASAAAPLLLASGGAR
jgi:signal transduction histidine kinase